MCDIQRTATREGAYYCASVNSASDVFAVRCNAFVIASFDLSGQLDAPDNRTRRVLQRINRTHRRMQTAPAQFDRRIYFVRHAKRDRPRIAIPQESRFFGEVPACYGIHWVPRVVS